MPPCSDPVKDLLSKLLTVAPEMRISVKEIKEHPAFKLFLQPGYIPPCPFSVTPKGPVVLKPEESEFPKVLLQMGFTSVEEVDSN